MRRQSTAVPVGVMSSILDNVPLAIVVLARDATPLYANAAAVALLGQEVGPSTSAVNLVSGLGARQAGTGEPYPVQRMPIVRAMGGEAAAVDDMEIDRPAGPVVLEVWAAPVPACETSAACVVAAFRDVTERRDSRDREAQLRRDILRQNRWLEAVRAIQGALGPGTDLDQALDLVAQRTRELLDGESTSIALRDGEGLLAIRVADGQAAERLRGVQVPVATSIMGDVVAMGAAAVLDDVACLGTLADPVSRLDLGPALVVPLTAEERVLGLLVVARSRGRALFTESELAAAEAVAYHAAGALHRQGILQSLLSLHRRLSDAAAGPGEPAGALQEAIDTLASVVSDLRGHPASSDGPPT